MTNLAERIDDLAAHSARLNRALQSGNAAMIEEATNSFCAAIEDAQATSHGTDDPALKERLIALRPELEETRKLACLLADMTGQMHELVTTRAGGPRQPLYKRSGARAG